MVLGINISGDNKRLNGDPVIVIAMSFVNSLRRSITASPAEAETRNRDDIARRAIFEKASRWKKLLPTDKTRKQILSRRW
jgi:hypothetical protein